MASTSSKTRPARKTSSRARSTSARTRTTTPVTPASTPTYKTVMVTPAMAEKWLETNTHNVALRQRIVDRYARDMEHGHWVMRGDAIEFAPDGTLLNGQHRLSAIVQSGATVTLLVGQNVPPEAQDVADSGRARTVADQLNLRGARNPFVLAAIARKGWLWDNGYRPGSSSNAAPTHTEHYDWLEANPDAEEAAGLAYALSKTIGIAPSITGFAFVLFARQSHADAVEFLARLTDGIGLETGSPILALRNRVIREKTIGGRLTPDEWTYLIFTAWNAWREGRTLAKIQLPRSDSPAAFPEPV